MKRLVELVSKKPVPDDVKYLTFEVCASDADGEDVELPTIRVRVN